MERFKLNVLAVSVAAAMRQLPHVLERVAFVSGVGLVVSGGLVTTGNAADAVPLAASDAQNGQTGAATKASSGGSSQAAPTDSPNLGTVVVSARKKLERAQEVPVAMSAVNSGTLIEQGRVSIRDIFQETPGVNYSAGDRGTSEISIRGITSGVSGNPTAAITIDDAPFGLSTAGGGTMLPDLDPTILERIEVLRGPQGTLYGASSLGGLLKYVTRQPDTNKFSGQVQIDGSTVEHGGQGFGLRAGVNIPIKEDVLGVQVSAFERRDAGFVDDTRQHLKDVDWTRTQGGRIAALLTPTESIAIKASALFQQTNSGGSSIVDTINGVPVYGDLAHQRIPGTDKFERNIGFYDLNAGFDLGWARLTSVTAYGRIGYSGPQDGTASLTPLLNEIGMPNEGAAVQNNLNGTKFSQELRLDSPEGKRALDWRIGLFYTQEHSDGTQLLQIVDPLTGMLIDGAPLVASSVNNTTFKEIAGYGSLTYHITNRFDVQGGLRYSHNNQSYTEADDGLLTGGPQFVNNGSSASKATYQVTPRFLFSKDLMAYATISTGYRPGGPNSGVAASAPRTYQSDSTTNYEIGVKGDLFDRRLSFATALYYIDWKNIQILGIDANGVSYFENGAGAKSEGWESSFVLAPARGLSISGNFVWSNAVLTQALPANSLNVGSAGSRLPFSSKFTASLGANQEFPIADAFRGFIGGSLNYVGDRVGNFEVAGVNRVQLPGFVTFDLQVGVKAKLWTVSMFAKNLADKRAYLGGTTRGAEVQYSVLPPRTIGISLSHQL